MDVLKRVICEELLEGKTVDLGIFKISLSVKGTLKSPDQPFRPNKRTKYEVKLSDPTEILQYIKGKIKFKRKESKSTNPLIQKVIHRETKEDTNIFKLNSFYTIIGENLKGIETSLEDGVFLKDAKTGIEYSTEVVINKIKQLTFLIRSNIPIGKYYLVVKSFSRIDR